MAWSVLQSASNGNANFGPPSNATYGTNLSSGSKLIAVSVCFGGTTSAVKDASSNSFGELATVALNNSTSTYGELSLWCLDTPAGDVGTKPQITATLTGTGSCTLVIQEVSGLATGSTAAAVLDGTYGTTYGTASGSIGPPSYASSAANEYLVYLYGDTGSGVTATVPASPVYTPDPNSAQASFACDDVIGYKNSTGTTETGQYSLNAGSDWGLLLVAFKLAGGVPGPPLFNMPAVSAIVVPGRAGWQNAGHSR